MEAQEIREFKEINDAPLPRFIKLPKTIIASQNELRGDTLKS